MVFTLPSVLNSARLQVEASSGWKIRFGGEPPQSASAQAKKD